MRTPFITKCISTISMLNTRLQIKEKHTRTNKTYLTLFQRPKTQLYSILYITNNAKSKTIITCLHFFDQSSLTK